MLTISARSSLLSINIAISSKDTEAGFIASCNFNKRAKQTQERENLFEPNTFCGLGGMRFALSCVRDWISKVSKQQYLYLSCA